ncbi:hypothetical protein ACOSQ4_031322 [Xanthoceras sorbifolium]
MSGSSIQRSRKNRGAETFASGRQGVRLSQGGTLGAIVFNQVDNLDQLGKMELIPSLYGQLLTFYLLFRRNRLPPPSDNVIRYCFTLKQCPLLRGSPEDEYKEVFIDQEKGWNPSPCSPQKDQEMRSISMPHLHLRTSSPSTMVGLAVFTSSSWGLGAVANEYLEHAPMCYEEFLTRGLSQHIKEDEGLNLHHTLVRHALLRPSLGSRSGLLARENPSTGRNSSRVDFASWRVEELLMLIGESLSILNQAMRDSTLSICIDLAS